MSLADIFYRDIASDPLEEPDESVLMTGDGQRLVGPRSRSLGPLLRSSDALQATKARKSREDALVVQLELDNAGQYFVKLATRVTSTAFATATAAAGSSTTQQSVNMLGYKRDTKPVGFIGMFFRSGSIIPSAARNDDGRRLQHIFWRTRTTICYA